MPRTKTTCTTSTLTSAIDCGACIPECPVNAIFEEAEVPTEWQHFIQINDDYFK